MSATVIVLPVIRVEPFGDDADDFWTQRAREKRALAAASSARPPRTRPVLAHGGAS
jgi:hypothetical protein